MSTLARITWLNTTAITAIIMRGIQEAPQIPQKAPAAFDLEIADHALINEGIIFVKLFLDL